MSNPTQNFIPIHKIRDGIVILRDGGMRSILLCSALNMSLKSGEEQEATIYQFQNFLNSLEFSTQIVVQSRRYDLRKYVLVLQEQLKKQTEDLLRIQIEDYIKFVQWFNDNHNVMTKYFYVIIPYTSTILGPGNKSVFDKVFGAFSSKNRDHNAQLTATNQKFEEARSQLMQRTEVIKAGLSSFGVKSERLDTQAAIELFYSIFNPGEDYTSIPETSE